MKPTPVDPALKLEPVEDNADFEKFIPMMFRAMEGSGPFCEAVWPNCYTPAGHKAAVERNIFLRGIDKSARWMKAIDTTTGEIVGVTSWGFHDETKPPEKPLELPPGTWNNDDDEKFAKELFASFVPFRWNFFRENDLPIVVCGTLAVAPEHQGRGAGTLMCEWGTKIADGMNAVCMVEATLAGRWVYEKAGFTVVEHKTLQVSDSFKDREKQRIFYMTRPRKGAKD